MESEKYSSAAERLEKLSAVDPDNPVIYYNLGVVYTFLKREDEAISRFEAAVRIYPGYYQAWYNLGQISLIRKKDFSRAFHCFDRAAAIRPDYVGAHHQRGVACELLGDKEAALKCYEKTLELEPDNKQALDSVRRLGAISDSDNPI
jgi:tetratricopeptide (TPR) repeat protein